MFFYYDFKHYFSKRSFPPINETQIYVQFPYDSSLFFFLFRQYIQEGDAWELSTVNDVRPGTSPQEPRNHQLLVKKHGENVYEKSIVVCSGVDMVNIQYMNIIFKDAPTAEVRITKNFRVSKFATFLEYERPCSLFYFSISIQNNNIITLISERVISVLRVTINVFFKSLVYVGIFFFRHGNWKSENCSIMSN